MFFFFFFPQKTQYKESLFHRKNVHFKNNYKSNKSAPIFSMLPYTVIKNPSYP